MMIERNLLALMLTNRLDPAMADIEEKHFSDFTHKNIWNAISSITLQKLTPDVATVAAEMDKLDNSFNWFVHLADMAKQQMGEYTAKGHITQLKESWRIRSIKDIGLQMASGENTDPNHFIKSLMELSRTEKKYLFSLEDAALNAVNQIYRVMDGEEKPVPTGLDSVDRMIGGLHNSDLIIIAARPAMGKTAFMLNMAAANKNAPLIFSTEQSNIQAAQRLFSIYGNVPGHKMRTGDVGDTELAQITSAIGLIKESKGWIYDKSGPYMSEIEATARQVYNDHGCSAIYLDYLQRIKHENPRLPKHEQVGDIAMRLKELARELDIPVVALAQVSRKVEERGGERGARPEMGDIKDSGTIEQEADMIMTLYRDEVYNPSTPDGGTAEVDFKKNRHGGTGMIRAKWIAPTMRFVDM